MNDSHLTDEMMESGVEAFMDAHKHHATPYGIVKAIWEAMLAKSDLRPVDPDDAEFGMSEHRNGCAMAVLSRSPTTGGITCTKCNSHAFHGEELKCRWTAVGFVMTQVEGLVISLESDVERLAKKLQETEERLLIENTAVAHFRDKAEAAEQRAAAMEANDRRYVWLRRFDHFSQVDSMLDTTNYNTLDAAVDAAIAAQSAGGGG